jgi:hypothetical protein
LQIRNGPVESAYTGCNAGEVKVATAFQVQRTGQSSGHCDCCGTVTKRIWGIVSQGRTGVAAYFVTWTTGRPDHGAAFDLIVGAWGEGATSADRSAVALEFRVVGGSPQFMVVDAETRPTADSGLVGKALARADVIGSPLAAHVFEIVDAVYLGEKALEELRGWP